MTTWRVALLLWLLAPWVRAELVVALSASVQNSARGREIVFSGSLTNSSATSKLYLNDIATVLNSGSPTDFPFQPNSFFSNVPGVLLPNESYTDSEIFRVALMAGAPAGDYRGTVTIRGGADIFANDDLAAAPYAVLSSAVVLAVSDASASEVGPDPGAVTITRSGGTDIDLPVALATSGSAVAGSDYETLPLSITIPAGSSFANVTVTPIPNNIAQGDRTATLTLGESSAYNLGTPIAGDIIIHDKPADAWRFGHFGANANDPAAADEADFDGDGISNLLEFALNLDPQNASVTGLPT
ncbi:MAG: hypothetical protein M3Y86_05525, partial [Verrucomicrobiota bacterium]|nr:hypothetical protein [Verrucomicrobiota bacterium]